MKLYYEESNEHMTQAHHNGLISGYDLKYAGVSGLESNHHRYDFTYDRAGSLQEANYYQWEMYTDPYGEVGWHWQGSDKYKVFNLSYDANGNILNLDRNDNQSQTTEYDYTYATNTNRLTSFNGVAGNFTYDASGSMIEDKNRNIENIEYNWLNLPRENE